MASIQFIGLEETIKAFNYRNAEVWAIFDGKRLIHKGEGENELREFLTMISNSGTTATYILKVYDDFSDPKNVKSNTPDDGSFNFKLFSVADGGAVGGIVRRHYGDPVQAEILAKLGALEQQINGEPDDEPDFMDQLGEAFIGMIQEPSRLNEFMGALRNFSNPMPSNPIRAGIGNVSLMREPTNNNQGIELTEQNLQRIGDAIEKMAKVDGGIVEHLEKLAAVAEKNPGKFKSLVSMLDTFI